MKSLGIIIKNNLKLILRNRVLVVVVTLSVVLVIAALSNAFHDLLGQAEKASDFTVGYQMSADSAYKPFEDTFVSSLDDEGVSCRKYSGEMPQEIIKSGEAEVFVDFSKDDYHIFGGSGSEIQTRTIQYVLFAADESIAAMTQGREKTSFSAASLPHTETADAENYYSIVEMAYYISLSSVFLCMIINEERKCHISIRYRIGCVGKAGQYFGKFIPCALTAVAFLVTASGVLVTLLFDVEWGSIPVAFGILSFEALAFSALGMVFFLIFENAAVAIGALFMPLWFAGFVGGTFESYMYSSFSESVKRLSPLYYINRTLCEYSVSGSSEYLAPCLVYLTALTAVSMILGILLTGRKER